MKSSPPAGCGSTATGPGKARSCGASCTGRSRQPAPPRCSEPIRMPRSQSQITSPVRQSFNCAEIMKLDFTDERVLAVVAHPDDAELLCAGTLARAKADGAAIAICILCRGDKGLPDQP